MLVNHVSNASIWLNIGCKTKKGILSCFRILFRSPLVGESQNQHQRLFTGTSGVLSTLPGRLHTSNTSSVSGHMLTKEWTHLQPIRYLNVDRRPINCVTRSVVFEDIQMYGMVHGGVYLTLTEEAGELAVRKYCSETQFPQHITAVPSMTKIEKSQFLGFATLGDVLEAEAEIIYTTSHSLRVLVSLYAAPVVQSKTRKSISKSLVWYELLNADKNTEVLPVPPLEIKDARLAEEGRMEHETILADRQSRKNISTTLKRDYSGSASLASTQIIDNSFSVFKLLSRASPALKVMDELAGLTAHLFTQAKCVTGSCDDVNFYSRLVPGCYMTVTTAVVFTSDRTIDVQSFADVEMMQDGRTVKERAAEAVFTFVCSKSSNQPATIRQFTPQTEFEKEIHERRMKAYQKRKQKSKSNN